MLSPFAGPTACDSLPANSTPTQTFKDVFNSSFFDLVKSETNRYASQMLTEQQ